MVSPFLDTRGTVSLFARRYVGQERIVAIQPYPVETMQPSSFRGPGTLGAMPLSDRKVQESGYWRLEFIFYFKTFQTLTTKERPGQAPETLPTTPAAILSERGFCPTPTPLPPHSIARHPQVIRRFPPAAPWHKQVTPSPS